MATLCSPADIALSISINVSGTFSFPSQICPESCRYLQQLVFTASPKFPSTRGRSIDSGRPSALTRELQLTDDERRNYVLKSDDRGVSSATSPCARWDVAVGQKVRELRLSRAEVQGLSRLPDSSACREHRCRSMLLRFCGSPRTHREPSGCCSPGAGRRTGP